MKTRDMILNSKLSKKFIDSNFKLNKSREIDQPFQIDIGIIKNKNKMVVNLKWKKN